MTAKKSTLIKADLQQDDARTATVTARNWTNTLAITGQQPVPAPKPTEALIAALAGCMISGIERESAAAGLKITSLRMQASGNRIMEESGPVLKDLAVHIEVATPEPEEKIRPILEALQHNGTVTNTLKLGQEIRITYQILPPESVQEL